MNTVIATFPEMDTDFSKLFKNMNAAEELRRAEQAELSQTMPVDPLALVLQWRAAGDYIKNPKLVNLRIYEDLEYRDGWVAKDYPEVEQQYIDQAEVINRHFRNKFLMIGLHGHDISPFRVALMDHLENPLNLVNKHIKILLRLPDFYQEDIVMNELSVKYGSVEIGSVELDSVIQHVATVHRVVSRNPTQRHYFKTADDKLLCIQVEVNNTLLPIINYIIKSKQPVSFRGTVYGNHIKGYSSFNYYMTGNNKYELY